MVSTNRAFDMAVWRAPDYFEGRIDTLRDDVTLAIVWAAFHSQNQSKEGVFLRAIGLMYFASVALDWCPVCSMMTWVATPKLAASVQ